jgi:ribulose-5-phosphate 4-epimerase/fuculose-1-phosphate aldolase
MTAFQRGGLAEQLAETAAAVVASGAISANGHGNVSLRVSGSSEMLFSTAPTLRGLTADMVARIGLDGKILEGEVPPINKAVIDMHTAIYADHPDVVGGINWRFQRTIGSRLSLTLSGEGVPSVGNC